LALTFRTRLVVAFVAVAAFSGGILATTSFLLTSSYRREAFERHAERQVRTSLDSARGRLSLEDFETMLADIQRRGGFSAVAVSDGLTFSSSPGLDADDIPEAPLPPSASGELLADDVDVDGAPFHVVGGRLQSAETDVYFFFPRGDLEASLAELRRTLLAGWSLAVALAALVGTAIARRTLRPVRRAAQASQAVADGLLHTRLQQDTDEFGTLASSFNRMVAAVEQQVDALRASAARERRFTADVAHELRTPLTGMVSAASLLEAHLPDLGDGPRRPAELLVGDVRRLRDLVLELLELARLDAGREEPHLESLSVRRSIESVVFASQRDGGGVRLDIDDNLTMCADRLRFGRVVANLVSNAVRHGGGEVEIAARAEGNRVVIDVMDRGPGVPADAADQVFERFAKLDATRSAEGSGLGLAIAAKQAQVQRGTLSVHDRAGGGAVFRFTLPVADAPESEGDEDPVPSERAPGRQPST
jgi:two-component system sensor histidine kinase MtrB